MNAIADASGQLMHIRYEGVNAVEVTTRDNGVTSTLVRYAYDPLNRLTEVSIDLSAEDGSVADGHQYLTRYTYDGDSRRVASVSQSDGSSVSFTYDARGRVTHVVDGEGQATTYEYSENDVQSHDLNTHNLELRESDSSHVLNDSALLTHRDIEETEVHGITTEAQTTELSSQSLSLNASPLQETDIEQRERDRQLVEGVLDTTVSGSQQLQLSVGELSNTRVSTQTLTLH